METKEIKLPFKVKKPILALGSQTKNTICFARGDIAYLSAVYSDLNKPEDFLSFEKSAQYFLKKRPKIIACDLHPEYQSTKYCQNLRLTTSATILGGPADLCGGYNLQLIQHHHAHIASCMAENGLKNQKLIGVAFDGTGLGTDNTLWGAEFFICDYKNFKRVAHLKEIPLLGGQKAILEPWRLSAAWLYLAYQDRFLNLKLGLTKGLKKKKWRLLKSMYLSGLNTPPASSMGRLFDAVAAIVLEKYKVNFEAELAMELEKIAISYKLSALSYKFKIKKEKEGYLLDPVMMFKEIINDLNARVAREKIAYRFHLTVAEMIKKTCLILRKGSGSNKVALSGGVFQNNLLLSLSSDLLYREGFQVLTHRKLSCNDSGISLGQAVVADARS